MSAVMVGVVWAAIGILAALADRHDRSAAWIVAGALFGPLWITVCADRRAFRTSDGEMRARGRQRVRTPDRLPA